MGLCFFPCWVTAQTAPGPSHIPFPALLSCFSIISKWKIRDISNVKARSYVSVALWRHPVIIMSLCETLSVLGWTSRVCWLLHTFSSCCPRLATYQLPKILSQNHRITKTWEIEIRGLHKATSRLPAASLTIFTERGTTTFKGKEGPSWVATLTS
jgi:hypothetical protein